MNPAKKNILKNNGVFLFINIFSFSWGFLNVDSIYPKSEAMLMSLIFLIILFLQFFLIFYFNKHSSIIGLFFSCGNFVFFNLILNGLDNYINLTYLVFFLLIYVYINHLSLIKTLIFFLVLFCSALVTNLFFFENNNEILIPKKTEKNKSFKANSNIFFIGIDGMMSNEMYNLIFHKNNLALNTLDSLGFLTSDIYSPGEGTLETYAKFISYKSNFHPRLSFKIINSKNSSFYVDTKKMGYKKQFNFATNSFGGDPNNIFDSYYPKESNPFSFVLYTPERWGWYSVYFIKKIFNSSLKMNNYNNQMDMIINRIKTIDFNKKNKWVSISHLYFPGHTASDYNFNNYLEFNIFKNYYRKSQTYLSRFFQKITKIILEIDRDAVIVFYGDHGSFILKRAKSNETINGLKITDELLLKDKKHVQIAVYPNDFLDSTDLKKIKLNPEYLFKIIIQRGGK